MGGRNCLSKLIRGLLLESETAGRIQAGHHRGDVGWERVDKALQKRTRER